MGWVVLLMLNRIYQTPFLLSIYRVFKYVIRLTTNTTELYRLCNLDISQDEKDFSASLHVSKYVVHRIEQSVSYSKELAQENTKLKQESCQVSQVIMSILSKKRFPDHTNDKTIPAQILSYSISRIMETNHVLEQVENKIATKYDTDNPLHEQKLLQLWSLMMPETKLEARISKQWVDIGFQGDDPATDFRGMGIEGLEDLIYFVERYPNHAASVLQHASHPIYWYPYAIVGINITKFAYQLLESKKLQLYLYQFGTEIDLFHEFYCYLFFQFNQFWVNHEPKLTVMDFESKFVEFKTQIEQSIRHEQVEPFGKYIE